MRRFDDAPYHCPTIVPLCDGDDRMGRDGVEKRVARDMGTRQARRPACVRDEA